jgi:FkbM family methyltransferase
MQIKKVLASAFYKLVPRRSTIVKSNLLGIEIYASKGTIRNTVDQDDAWFYYLAKNAKSVFDIGANTGYTAFLAVLGNPRCRVVLVDANPKALSEAADNLILNNLSGNCNFYPSFVGDKSSNSIKFYTVGSGEAGSMFRSHAHTAAQLNESIEVPTTTIDHLADYYGFDPEFVKVDVEGAESLVLQGAVKLASKGQTRFLVEMHSPEEMPMKRNAQFVLDWCTKNNFAPWYLKDASILEDADTIAHRGKCHLLLQPKGWMYPEYLSGVKQRNTLPIHGAKFLF